MSEGGRPGTIVELNPVDALGWIELDEGGRIRFGGTACKGFRGEAPIDPKATTRSPMVALPFSTSRRSPCAGINTTLR